MTCFDDDNVAAVLEAHAPSGSEREPHWADELSVGRVIDRRWEAIVDE